MTGAILLRDQDDPHRVVFWCPGCRCGHAVIVGGQKHPVWTWNGSVGSPTFKPSVLTWTPGPDGKRERVCHSFVTDGKIRFLGDCHHELAGQTVDLEPFQD